jgi:hypothetical protein
MPCGIGINLTLEEEAFLLALRIECPNHPNMDYVAKLKDFYDHDISASSTISVWFRKHYDYTVGTFKVPNLVPIDKWMMMNATRVMAYPEIMDIFPNNSKWNFLNEKHIVNGGILLPKKVIVAIVSGSLMKPSSIAYHITKENGNPKQSVAFIKMLIITSFFLDNARIHTAGEAKCVKFFCGTPLYLDYYSM